MKSSENNTYVVSVINTAEFQKTVPMHPQSLSAEKATGVFQKQGALVAKTLSMEKLDQFASSLKKLPEDYLFQLRYFDNTMIGDDKTASTRSNYLNYTARFMTWYNWQAQGESLLNVTTDHLRLYRSTALTGLKKSSMNQQMCALNHFFENVCSKHVKLDSMRTEMFMPLVPNRQQVRQMFRGCATPAGRPEAQGVDPVFHGDHHRMALPGGQVLTVVEGIRRATPAVGAAVDPEHHGPAFRLLFPGEGGRPHVHRQTFLRHLLSAGDGFGMEEGLDGHGPEGGGIHFLRAHRNRHGRAEPGRRGIADSPTPGSSCSPI